MIIFINKSSKKNQTICQRMWLNVTNWDSHGVWEEVHQEYPSCLCDLSSPDLPLATRHSKMLRFQNVHAKHSASWASFGRTSGEISIRIFVQLWLFSNSKQINYGLTQNLHFPYIYLCFSISGSWFENFSYFLAKKTE